MVLKYLVVNEAKFLKCYHNRVYFYSSGTVHAASCRRLEQWMQDVDGAEQSDTDASSFHSSALEDDASDKDDASENEEADNDENADEPEGNHAEEPEDKPADDVPRADMMAEDMIRKVRLYTNMNACLQTACLQTLTSVYKQASVYTNCLSINMHVCIQP